VDQEPVVAVFQIEKLLDVDDGVDRRTPGLCRSVLALERGIKYFIILRGAISYCKIMINLLIIKTHFEFDAAHVHELAKSKTKSPVTRKRDDSQTFVQSVSTMDESVKIRLSQITFPMENWLDEFAILKLWFSLFSS
jgi:hypothetical protein